MAKIFTALVLALAGALAVTFPVTSATAHSPRRVHIDGRPVTGQKLPTGVNRINAEAKANKGTGINIAVVDTGIDLAHPDLAANIVGGVNCNDGSSYSDQNGHGTHVAGTIAALDNSYGVVGVAPEAKLWAVRVLDANGSGTDANVVCGLDFVDAHSPAHGGSITLVNMSLGAPGADDGACGAIDGDLIHAAVCRLVADGVMVVASAGNDGTDLATHVPGAYREVLTATALDDINGLPCSTQAQHLGGDDDFVGWSNYAVSASDLAHTIGAPGTGILSTWIGDSYAELSGTSMSAPHVTGSAALYLATHPGDSPSAVQAALLAAGEPLNVNFNGECKNGRVSHHDGLNHHPEVVVRDDGF